MERLTADELIEILRDCAGEDEGAGLTGDALDRPWEELGYDSIAVLETAGRLQRRYGPVLPDDALSELASPRELIDRVNAALARA